MLRNTFILLEGITSKREQELWNAGIRTWNDFLAAKSIKGISPKRKGHYDRSITEFRKSYEEEDYAYFSDKLAKKESWRLYPELKEHALFLDIETSYRNKEITVIGLSDGYETTTLVRGANLDRTVLAQIMDRYKLLITFNGSSFDIPLIEKRFSMKILHPHLDLKHVCSHAGLTGGLKQIEEELGIKRPEHLRPKSCNPVELWRAFHASGDYEYLQLLIDYNREDVENLKRITEVAIKRIIAQLNI